VAAAAAGTTTTTTEASAHIFKIKMAWRTI
jgi:hypothetical protein